MSEFSRDPQQPTDLSDLSVPAPETSQDLSSASAPTGRSRFSMQALLDGKLGNLAKVVTAMAAFAGAPEKAEAGVIDTNKSLQQHLNFTAQLGFADAVNATVVTLQDGSTAVSTNSYLGEGVFQLVGHGVTDPVSGGVIENIAIHIGEDANNPSAILIPASVERHPQFNGIGNIHDVAYAYAPEAAQMGLSRLRLATSPASPGLVFDTIGFGERSIANTFVFEESGIRMGGRNLVDDSGLNFFVAEMDTSGLPGYVDFEIGGAGGDSGSPAVIEDVIIGHATVVTGKIGGTLANTFYENSENNVPFYEDFKARHVPEPASGLLLLGGLVGFGLRRNRGPKSVL